MSEDPNKLTTLAGATIASFVMSAVLGIAAFFLFWGLGSAMHGAPASQGTVFLFLLALVCGAGAIFFAWIGVRTIWVGARERAKPKRDPLEEEREYYSRFPVPKD